MQLKCDFLSCFPPERTERKEDGYGSMQFNEVAVVIQVSRTHSGPWLFSYVKEMLVSISLLFLYPSRRITGYYLEFKNFPTHQSPSSQLYPVCTLTESRNNPQQKDHFAYSNLSQYRYNTAALYYCLYAAAY